MSEIAIVSQDFGLLAKCLAAALQEHTGTLRTQWIVVPNVSLKQWLLVQLASFSPSGCVAGYKICTMDEMLYAQFPCIPARFEMRCLIYDALVTDLDRLELTRHLTDLFFSYGKYGIPNEEGWQLQLFTNLLSSKFQLPIQFLSKKEFFTNEPCHFFGFNALPPVYWNYLSKAQGYFYLFSPCFHFWEDVRTKKEQRRARSFDDAPCLLANLGKLGREKVLDLDIVPVYAPTHTKTNLGALQSEIVTFEKCDQEKKPDESLQVFLTGASQICEVEAVGKEILRLCQEKGCSFSEILILAPDIQEYIPIVEYIFAKLSIPYRFSQKITQSSFYQGILRLIALMKGPWTAEKIKALLETTSFSQKFHLEEKERAHWIQWTEDIFQFSADWEQGFAQLLKNATTLTPGPSKEMIFLSSFDSLEKFLELLQSLQTDLCYKNKTLEKWADQIDAMAEKYLQSEDELLSATKNLRLARLDNKEFPFEVIEDLFTQNLYSSYHGNHLHAVCLASIGEGTVVPSCATFLLGMDEESFPRKKQATSLDLVKKEPDRADVDRYIFLQILLNTKEYLIMSYGHISPDDGKQVGASIVVNELLDEWPAMIKTILSSPAPQHDLVRFTFACPAENEPKKAILTLTELSFFARNPWKYYLQKVENIALEKRKELSFRAVRSTLLRSTLEWPVETVLSASKKRYPGIFQEALFLDIQDKSIQMKKQLDAWGKKKISLNLYQTANGGESPSIKLGPVEIVGEIPHCMEDGALHFGDDHISSLLRIWPEALTACVVLQTPKIYFLKTGKIKTMTHCEQALQKFVDYYLRCQNGLSPLIPDWAEAFLRNKEFSPEFAYDDEVTQWIHSRLEIPKTIIEEWKWLKETFAELIGLY